MTIPTAEFPKWGRVQAVSEMLDRCPDDMVVLAVKSATEVRVQLATLTVTEAYREQGIGVARPWPHRWLVCREEDGTESVFDVCCSPERSMA